MEVTCFGFRPTDQGFAMAGIFNSPQEARLQQCTLVEGAKCQDGITRLPAGFYDLLKPDPTAEVMGQALARDIAKWGAN